MNLDELSDPPVSEDVATVLNFVSQRGHPMIAGGAVRDWLLGELSKDLDVEVFGCSWDDLISVLKPLGKVDLVGKSFGVAKFQLGNREIDFALPRAEKKTSSGHRGFEVTPDPDLDPQKAALRRDFTINSISYDWKNQQLVDPLNGIQDLKTKILRHSSSSFIEDPLRVLRGFQFCSRFELKAAEETINLCQRIFESFHELPKERVWMEWEKWATRSLIPSSGLHFLKQTKWLQHFPEIFALVDCPQDPIWHPEGDVFIHTCHCLDALVQSEFYQAGDRLGKLTLSFAVLTHDLGKPETTKRIEKDGKLRWVSPGHDQVGIPLVENFLLSIGAPHALVPKVQALVGSHMASIQINKRPSLPQVRRLASRVAPASLDELFTVIRSDQAGRPPLSNAPSKGLLLLEEVAQEEALHQQAPKPMVLGRHLIDFGLKPGAHFKPILRELFEMQLDGAFSSIEEAEPFIQQACVRHLT